MGDVGCVHAICSWITDDRTERITPNHELRSKRSLFGFDGWGDAFSWHFRWAQKRILERILRLVVWLIYSLNHSTDRPNQRRRIRPNIPTIRRRTTRRIKPIARPHMRPTQTFIEPSRGLIRLDRPEIDPQISVPRRPLNRRLHQSRPNH
jgi:hypothetical protein